MESLQNTFLRANSFIDSFLWAASEGRGGVDLRGINSVLQGSDVICCT